MAEQRPLFRYRPPPRSHTHDPATSKDAETRTRGVRGRQAREVLALVLLHPGCTATELAERVSVDFAAVPWERRQSVRRRLSDLKVLGQVRRGDRKGDEYTWVPA